MKAFFWNLAKRPLLHMVRQAVTEHRPDVVILAEVQDTDDEIAKALVEVSASVYWMPARPRNARLRIFTRLPLEAVEPLEDKHYVAVLRIAPPLGDDVLLAAVHFGSKLFQTEPDLDFFCTRVRQSIESWETARGHHRALIIGDFNMNPFEKGVVAAEGLHAVMTREIALEESRIVSGELRRYFYSPMWNHFGERPPSPPGTYYYRGSKQIVFFWNMFDQVLLRPALLKYFGDDDFQVVTTIGGVSLLTATGLPNRALASDHLPVVVEVHTERSILDGEEPMGEPQGYGGADDSAGGDPQGAS